MKFRIKRNAFTLIELMIVIAIIGVLAAIALPNFRKAQFKAKSVACIETLKGIETALEMYMIDFPPDGIPVVMNLTNDPFLAFLQKNSYYKSVPPKCGLGGRYQIQPTVPTGSGVNLGVYHVECTFHGTLSQNLGGK